MRTAILVLTLLWPASALAADITASRTLPAGTVITQDDLTVAANVAPALADGMVGQETRITIYAGRPISANHLRRPRLINRNQMIPLIFQRGTLRIKAEGRALSEGSAGDTITVMNMASRTTVSARIAADGTVHVAR